MIASAASLVFEKNGNNLAEYMVNFERETKNKSKLCWIRVVLGKQTPKKCLIAQRLLGIFGLWRLCFWGPLCRSCRQFCNFLRTIFEHLGTSLGQLKRAATSSLQTTWNMTNRKYEKQTIRSWLNQAQDCKMIEIRSFRNANHEWCSLSLRCFMSKIYWRPSKLPRWSQPENSRRWKLRRHCVQKSIELENLLNPAKYSTWATSPCLK